MHRLSNSRMLQNHAGALLKGSFKSPTSGSSSWRQVPGDVLLNKRHVAQGQIYSCLGTLFPSVVAECVGEVVFTRFLCIRGYKCPSSRSLSTNTNKVPSINKAFSCLKVLEVAGQLSFPFSISSHREVKRLPKREPLTPSCLLSLPPSP